MTPSPFLQKKRNAYRKGVWAERLAAFYLRCLGYRILARRLRGYGGEADIVAQKGDVIVVCEVKFRRTKDAAAYAVTPAQQARLRRGGEYALARFGVSNARLRFDAVLFSFNALPTHLRNVIGDGNG
ncbi:MAG: YraN family protein [Rickettsiales bacterium]